MQYSAVQSTYATNVASCKILRRCQIREMRVSQHEMIRRRRSRHGTIGLRHSRMVTYDLLCFALPNCEMTIFKLFDCYQNNNGSLLKKQLGVNNSSSSSSSLSLLEATTESLSPSLATLTIINIQYPHAHIHNPV